MSTPSSVRILPFSKYSPRPLQKTAALIGAGLPVNWIGRRIAALLRSLIHRIARQPVDVERLGFKIRLHLNDNACERRLMVTPHFFEPEALAVLAPKIGPGFHFVDVGANVGIYSLFVAQHINANAKILAIEPQPILCARLRENIELNGYEVAIASTAVFDFNGSVSLARDHKNLGASGIVGGLSGGSSSSNLSVSCYKLLDVIEQHDFNKIEAMKIDIEGHEERVLRPFIAEAPSNLWPKLLIIAMHDSPANHGFVLELEAAGWTLLKRTGRNCILHRGT